MLPIGKSAGTRALSKHTKEHMPPTTAIYVFISCVVLNVFGLLLDVLLYLAGLTTITETVREHHIVGVPLVLLQAVAVVSLAIHFWWSS